MHRRPLPAVVGLVALALALTACTVGEPTAVSIGGEIEVEAPQAVASAPAAVTSPEPAAEPSVEPTEAEQPAAPAAPAFSFDVAKAQRTLADLGYYLGAADGRRGSAFRSAVMAFQKVQGLGADGVVGPATLKALEAPKKPVLKGSTPKNRVEVDLTKQVLYVVKGGVLQRILPVSSGNGATYEQKDGSKARALTPTGYYRIQRRIVGVREADLGTLYDPQYFYRGWAIHGSNSVPAFPASHGCIRVTRADAKWLLGQLTIGMTVHIYGGKHVFTAGSSAPGTDTPTGDTASNTSPSPATKPSPKPSPKSSPKPSSAPAPVSPPPAAPSPSPVAPQPSASPPVR